MRYRLNCVFRERDVVSAGEERPGADAFPQHFRGQALLRHSALPGPVC